MKPAGPPLKLAAHDLIDRLPSDATWNDLVYAIYVRQSIEAGLKDVQEGRVLSTAEVRWRLSLPSSAADQPHIREGKVE